MIEVVYKKENTGDSHQDVGFKLPKNIKQIGGGDTDVQVYMEDNVALYLSKVPDREEDIRYGVLVGNVKRSCGYTYIFINGAVDVREVFDNTVIFSDDIWTSLNDDIYRYFQGSKIVGWFLSQCYSGSSQNMWIKKMHLNNFAGMDKVFFKIDRDEEEEGFYSYGTDKMEKLPCYHIYYEKNVLMNEYMLGTNADVHFRKAVSGEERTGSLIAKKAEQIKNTIAEKAEKSENKSGENQQINYRKYNRILSKAASVMIIGALAVTVGIMGKQGKLDNLTGELKSLVSGIMNGGDEPAGGDGIISVNGVPNKESGMEETREDETTSDETGEGQTTTQNEASATTAEETTTLSGEQQTVSPITPVSTSNYMVEKGETLYSICMKLYGSINNMNTIIELNNLDSADSIYYGKNLIVP